MPDPDRPRPSKSDGVKAKPQKVSQKTINDIKTMGMSKAIAKAAGSGASSEFREGAKRMYGAERIRQAQMPKGNVKSSASVSKTAARPSAQMSRSLAQTKGGGTTSSSKSVAIGKNSKLNKKSTT